MRQALGDLDDRADEFELVGDQRDDGYAAPDRRFPSMLFSVLIMALFAGGLWFAYHLGSRRDAATVAGGGVPVIRADRGPDKVRPEQPGGMKIPDQNASIYDEKPGVSPVENLLPPPEKPLPRPAPPPAAPRQAAASAPASPPPITAPAVSMPPPQAAPLVLPPRPAAVATVEAAPPSVRAPAIAPPAREAGTIHIQLASVRTPDDARAEWARLKRDNADLLARLSAFAVRADLGDKGVYYRVEAGPFADVATAARLCGELKRRNFGCVVER